MIRWNARFLVLALAAALPALAAAGPEGGEPTPPDLRISTSLSPTPVVAPGEATLTLTVEIPTGYHLFAGKDLRVEAEGPLAPLLGTPAYPAGEVEEGIAVLRGRTAIRIPLTVPAGAAGPIRGTLLLKWQACQDYGEKICFLPTRSTVSIEAPLAAAPPSSTGSVQGALPPAPPVVEPAVEPAPPREAVPPREAPQGRSFQDRFGQAARENVPLALLLAFLFGILSSLTPCVYPVIPITVAYIGSRSEGKGRTHGFLLSLAFVLGLALVYAALGAVSAKAGQTFGSLAQTPWVGIPVALLFFALALSMFNLFEFKTPAGLTNRIERTKLESRGGGFVGAFLIGALSGLVASPCIGPLILAILVVVASTGSSLLGFLYLFTFALGLGVLFLVIGTFSGVLAALPKSGGWMDGVRVLFGALILAAAFYFAGLYLPRPAFWMASGLGLGFVAGFLLFGASRHFFSVPARVEGLVLCAAALLLVLPLLPPAPSSSRGTHGWHGELEAGLRDGGARNVPVLLDFRADWCVACVELEKKTWSDPDVERLLRRMAPVRLDVTRNSPADQEIQSRYSVRGLPTVILLDPQGKELARFVGFKSPADLIAWARPHVKPSPQQGT